MDLGSLIQQVHIMKNNIVIPEVPIAIQIEQYAKRFKLLTITFPYYFKRFNFKH